MHISTRQARHRHRRRVAAVAAALVVTACGQAPATSPATGPATQAAPVSAAPASAAPASAAPASAAPASAAPAASPGPALSRCTSAELRVTLGPADAAAGSVYRPLVFTNAGSRACELRGFPGVSYVAGDDGHQVGPAAQMSGARGAQVVVPPGGSASAQLQLAEVRNFDPAVCRPTPVRGLRVYPPGDTAAVFVATAGTGCTGTPPGPQLTVRTITRS